MRGVILARVAVPVPAVSSAAASAAAPQTGPQTWGVAQCPRRSPATDTGLQHRHTTAQPRSPESEVREQVPGLGPSTECVKWVGVKYRAPGVTTVATFSFTFTAFGIRTHDLN